MSNASVFGLLASVHMSSNVDRASNAVTASSSIVRFLVPVRTTTNATAATNAVAENASVVCLLVPVRTTTSVALERIIVGQCNRPIVLGAVGLLQALSPVQLRSSLSPFPLYPCTLTTAIVHPLLWLSANSRNDCSV